MKRPILSGLAISMLAASSLPGFAAPIAVPSVPVPGTGSEGTPRRQRTRHRQEEGRHQAGGQAALEERPALRKLAQRERHEGLQPLWPAPSRTGAALGTRRQRLSAGRHRHGRDRECDRRAISAALPPSKKATLVGRLFPYQSEHLVAKWHHLALQKCAENKNLERFRISVKNGNALVRASFESEAIVVIRRRQSRPDRSRNASSRTRIRR